MGIAAPVLGQPVAGLALALLALGAGCAATVPASNAGPDAHELSNLDPVDIAPKSSPRQIATAFETACIDGPRSFPAAEAALRKAGFVPLPATGDGGVVAFASDDKRPMILVSRAGRSCAVGAASRTGQTAKLRELVAKRYPTAVPFDTAGLAQRGVEQAWQVEGGIVYLQRVASPFDTSRLIFGIWRTT